MRILDYQAVIFDMDGLMLDTERVYRQAFQMAVRDGGREISDTDYLDLVGRNSKGARQVLIEKMGADFPLELVYERLWIYCDELLATHGIAVKEGLHELLDFLEEHCVPRAVATSTQTARAWEKLRATGLAGRFETVIGGDQVSEGKPSPEIYLKACAAIGVEPSRALALEDSEPGIRAAHAAGLTCIMVPDLKQPGESIVPLTLGIMPSLGEVRQYLKAYRVNFLDSQ